MDARALLDDVSEALGEARRSNGIPGGMELWTLDKPDRQLVEITVGQLFPVQIAGDENFPEASTVIIEK